MKALTNWRRRLLVPNTLRWQSTRNLICTRGFWFTLLLISSPLYFITVPFMFNQNCTEDSCSFLPSVPCFHNVQDNLDQQVDSTNSNLQVESLQLLHAFLAWISPDHTHIHAPIHYSLCSLLPAIETRKCHPKSQISFQTEENMF